MHKPKCKSTVSFLFKVSSLSHEFPASPQFQQYTVLLYTRYFKFVSPIYFFVISLNSIQQYNNITIEKNNEQTKENPKPVT